MATATKKSSSSASSKVPTAKDAEKLAEDVKEIQRENALENLTNVPTLHTFGEVRSNPEPVEPGDDAEADLKDRTELIATVEQVGNDLVLKLEKNPAVLSGEDLKAFQRIFDRAARSL
jgi:hypothetical protein